MCQQPDAAAKAQKQDAKVDRVEPGLQKGFHFVFSV
jgi:hypothetical protein